MARGAGGSHGDAAGGVAYRDRRRARKPRSVSPDSWPRSGRGPSGPSTRWSKTRRARSRCALSYHEARWRLITTIAIEDDHAEIRRRTRDIRVFVNAASYLRLASALATGHDEQRLSRRYVDVATSARSTEDAADAA